MDPASTAALAVLMNGLAPVLGALVCLGAPVAIVFTVKHFKLRHRELDLEAELHGQADAGPPRCHRSPAGHAGNGPGGAGAGPLPDVVEGAHVAAGAAAFFGGRARRGGSAAAAQPLIRAGVTLTACTSSKAR